MSYLDTRQALFTQLLTVISDGDLAFENDDFDPANRDLWYAAYFIPAITETTGKTLLSSDEQRGVFQVSVFMKLNAQLSDNAILQAIDTVLSAFRYSDSLVYNGQQVDILESEVNSGTENESWFKRDISINYLTFSERL